MDDGIVVAATAVPVQMSQRRSRIVLVQEERSQCSVVGGAVCSQDILHARAELLTAFDTEAEVSVHKMPMDLAHGAEHQGIVRHCPKFVGDDGDGSKVLARDTPS